MNMDGSFPNFYPHHDGGETIVERLRLSFGFDTTRPQPLGTVVQGLLHAGSVTLIYGPPKSGKSFLATDLALSVTAEEPDWMGHQIIRPGPVLYVACEGHAGFWKRLTAAAKVQGWDNKTFPAGFILAMGRPMLIRADARGNHYAPDPSSIIAALADAKQVGLHPVAIIVDTVFRSIGAGNVNASPDMNAYLASVATLTDEGYAVALVHHEIKSGGTAAGSVSLIGGSDTIIHVWREKEASGRRFWQIEMAKDDAETAPRAFVLEVVPIGMDPEGQPASSCVVRDEGMAPEAMQAKRRGRPLSEGSDQAVLAELIFRELSNCLADPSQGATVSIAPGSTPIRAVSRAEFRATVKRSGITVADNQEGNATRAPKSTDKAIQRAFNRLKIKGKIAMNERWIGLPK